MIENFAPQPYPLECQFDGGPWALVLGWQRDAAGALMLLPSSPEGTTTRYDAGQLRYRTPA